MERYNHLNSYLKNRFGKRTLKICVDGNFTCPNRDGTKGLGGCIFCGSSGAGENIKGKCEDTLDSIKNQVNLFLSSYRGLRAEQFIVYFQSFSGTYDTTENLKKKYDMALSQSDKIIGLEVATRPDLIDDDVAKLLALYKSKYYVCVELGLQTTNLEIAEKINRCYSNEDFARACKILKSYDIDIVAHIMVGLNESEEDLVKTTEFINDLGVNGVKIHNTYVLRNTKLGQMYLSGEYKPLKQSDYELAVCKIISYLRPDIIIHRITGDPPKDVCLAPEWAMHKKLILNGITKRLNDLDIYQGDNYKGKVNL